MFISCLEHASPDTANQSPRSYSSRQHILSYIYVLGVTISLILRTLLFSCARSMAPLRFVIGTVLYRYRPLAHDPRPPTITVNPRPNQLPQM